MDPDYFKSFRGETTIIPNRMNHFYEQFWDSPFRTFFSCKVIRFKSEIHTYIIKAAFFMELFESAYIFIHETRGSLLGAPPFYSVDSQKWAAEYKPH